MEEGTVLFSRLFDHRVLLFTAKDVSKQQWLGKMAGQYGWAIWLGSVWLGSMSGHHGWAPGLGESFGDWPETTGAWE